jgi:hypothetical protein
MSLKDLRPFLDKLNNGRNHRMISAYLMLENVDLMVDRYFKFEAFEKGDILLKVFGLLQALFVGVDSLYDLSIGITANKYYININQNKIMHQLKYIRNDIVGHPTNRTYDQGKIGFSILDLDQLTNENLKYKTYVYDKNVIDTVFQDVSIAKLIRAYHLEKDVLLKDLLVFLKTDVGGTILPELIFDLYQTRQMHLLEKIEKTFYDVYGVKNPNHRLIWRLNLVKVCFKWHEEDLELETFVNYILSTQIIKLYKIALDLDRRRLNLPYAKVPKILSATYKFLDKNHDLLPYLENLHDFDHPLHKHDVNVLLSHTESPYVIKLLNFLNNQTDETKVYLIGSTIKAFVPRKKS